MPSPEINKSSLDVWNKKKLATYGASYSSYSGIVYLNQLPSYDELFQHIFTNNQLCIVGETATSEWRSRKLWVCADGSPNFDYISDAFGDVTGPVADCSAEAEFCAHPKSTMLVKDFVAYWKKFKSDGYPAGGRCWYLKDWHFTKCFPDYKAYTPPAFLCSDWLNEFWDVAGSESGGDGDDYRFVYMGPQGSWTPFHADVLRSYSWSANICGRKMWIFFPPGVEELLKDQHDQLIFDLRSEDLTNHQKYPHAKAALDKAIVVVQNPGEIIFVPSGWHHQVFNLEDTISINHNWINGCNVDFMWRYLKTRLDAVKLEISDCRDMDGWDHQCQMILKADAGMDYSGFYTFLTAIAKHRILALKKYLKQAQDKQNLLQEGSNVDPLGNQTDLECTRVNMPESAEIPVGCAISIQYEQNVDRMDGEQGEISSFETKDLALDPTESMDKDVKFRLSTHKPKADCFNLLEDEANKNEIVLGKTFPEEYCESPFREIRDTFSPSLESSENTRVGVFEPKSSYYDRLIEAMKGNYNVSGSSTDSQVHTSGFMTQENSALSPNTVLDEKIEEGTTSEVQPSGYSGPTDLNREENSSRRSQELSATGGEESKTLKVARQAVGLLKQSWELFSTKVINKALLPEDSIDRVDDKCCYDYEEEPSEEFSYEEEPAVDVYLDELAEQAFYDPGLFVSCFKSEQMPSLCDGVEQESKRKAPSENVLSANGGNSSSVITCLNNLDEESEETFYNPGLLMSFLQAKCEQFCEEGSCSRDTMENKNNKPPETVVPTNDEHHSNVRPCLVDTLCCDSVTCGYSVASTSAQAGLSQSISEETSMTTPKSTENNSFQSGLSDADSNQTFINSPTATGHSSDQGASSPRGSKQVSFSTSLESAFSTSNSKQVPYFPSTSDGNALLKTCLSPSILKQKTSLSPTSNGQTPVLKSPSPNNSPSTKIVIPQNPVSPGNIMSSILATPELFNIIETRSQIPTVLSQNQISPHGSGAGLESATSSGVLSPQQQDTPAWKFDSIPTRSTMATLPNSPLLRITSPEGSGRQPSDDSLRSNLLSTGAKKTLLKRLQQYEDNSSGGQSDPLDITRNNNEDDDDADSEGFYKDDGNGKKKDKMSVLPERVESSTSSQYETWNEDLSDGLQLARQIMKETTVNSQLTKGQNFLGVLPLNNKYSHNTSHAVSYNAHDIDKNGENDFGIEGSFLVCHVCQKVMTSSGNVGENRSFHLEHKNRETENGCLKQNQNSVHTSSYNGIDEKLNNLLGNISKHLSLTNNSKVMCWNCYCRGQDKNVKSHLGEKLKKVPPHTISTSETFRHESSSQEKEKEFVCLCLYHMNLVYEEENIWKKLTSQGNNFLDHCISFASPNKGLNKQTDQYQSAEQTRFSLPRAMQTQLQEKYEHFKESAGSIVLNLKNSRLFATNIESTKTIDSHPSSSNEASQFAKSIVFEKKSGHRHGSFSSSGKSSHERSSSTSKISHERSSSTIKLSYEEDADDSSDEQEDDDKPSLIINHKESFLFQDKLSDVADQETFPKLSPHADSHPEITQRYRPRSGLKYIKQPKLFDFEKTKRKHLPYGKHFLMTKSRVPRSNRYKQAEKQLDREANSDHSSSDESCSGSVRSLPTSTVTLETKAQLFLKPQNNQQAKLRKKVSQGCRTLFCIKQKLHAAESSSRASSAQYLHPNEHDWEEDKHAKFAQPNNTTDFVRYVSLSPSDSQPFKESETKELQTLQTNIAERPVTDNIIREHLPSNDSSCVHFHTNNNRNQDSNDSINQALNPRSPVRPKKSMSALAPSNTNSNLFVTPTNGHCSTPYQTNVAGAYFKEENNNINVTLPEYSFNTHVQQTVSHDSVNKAIYDKYFQPTNSVCENEINALPVSIEFDYTSNVVPRDLTLESSPKSKSNTVQQSESKIKNSLLVDKPSSILGQTKSDNSSSLVQSKDHNSFPPSYADNSNFPLHPDINDNALSSFFTKNYKFSSESTSKDPSSFPMQLTPINHNLCPHWAHCGPNLALFDLHRVDDVIRDLQQQKEFDLVRNQVPIYLPLLSVWIKDLTIELRSKLNKGMHGRPPSGT